MAQANAPVQINRSVVEQLMVDAMLLADEAESYFAGEDPEGGLSVDQHVELACEAFRTVAILKGLVERLGQPALPADLEPLSPIPDSLDAAELPPKGRAILAATRALHERVRDFEARRSALTQFGVTASPARLLQDRLAASIAR
ncbi:MAG: hypothetical protein RQ833_07135 [Sphingomonadaceae bacterium]|nr:hypothetical protein [Sphingomonadaceae bacterium]